MIAFYFMFRKTLLITNDAPKKLQPKVALKLYLNF